MRAMILAAGRGERMGDLTLKTPKPLLHFQGKYLIEYSIESLVRAGVTDIVINISYLAEHIERVIGKGERYGANIIYSHEPARLETGGGIVKALPLLGNEPFLVISSDIISDYPLQNLKNKIKTLAHLVLVDNPSFKPQGDFGLKEGYVDLNAKPTYTYANIGIYHPDLFSEYEVSHFPLNKILFPAIKNHLITGEYFKNAWQNFTSPSQL